MAAPVTIPAIPNTWTPSNAPADAVVEMGSVSQPVGLGSAKMKAEFVMNRLNVRMYGAVGDGTTNDAPAIQAALDALAAAQVNANRNSIAILEFGPGNYKCATGVSIKAGNIILRGLKARLFASAAMTTLFKFGNNLAASTPENVVIEDLYLDGNSLANYCFQMTQGVSVSLRQIHTAGQLVAGFFFDGAGATTASGTYDVTLYECMGSGPGYGFYFNKGGNIGAYESFLMVGCTAEGGTHGIKSVGTFSLNIISGVYENHTVADIAADATKVVAISVFTENGNAANDVVLTNGAIFMPYGNTNPGSVSNTASFYEQRAYGRVVIMNDSQNDPLGELLVGWLTNGAKNMTRLGHSRILNFNDSLFARNLGPVIGADTYQTFQTGPFAGIEYRYDGGGKMGVAFYSAAADQTGLTPFTPTICLFLDGDGNFGVNTGAGPLERFEVGEPATKVVQQSRYKTDADAATFNDVVIAEWRAAVGAIASPWTYYPGIRVKGAANSSFARRFKTILMTTNSGEVEAVTLHPEGVAQLVNLTVAGLTAANLCQGAIAYVTDATATTRLSTVAGGGSNKVMVMSDGTNWLIL